MKLLFNELWCFNILDCWRCPQLLARSPFVNSDGIFNSTLGKHTKHEQFFEENLLFLIKGDFILTHCQTNHVMYALYQLVDSLCVSDSLLRIYCSLFGFLSSSSLSDSHLFCVNKQKYLCHKLLVFAFWLCSLQHILYVLCNIRTLETQSNTVLWFSLWFI